MAKFTEAEQRLFHNVYVCKRCKSKIRVNNPKEIRLGRAKCRKCGSKDLRLKRKK
ncbi:50S ribosomal protein L40e [Nanoarchaeota archaeon]|nr:MAG: 50S ribosomal protein L40e [Nanoarchaeota archaeon]